MYQTQLKALDISSATASLVPDLLKPKKVYYVQMSEDLQLIEKTWNYMEVRKKATYFEVFRKAIIYKFFKDFTNYGKKTNRTIVFRCRPVPNILKYRECR